MHKLETGSRLASKTDLKLGQCPVWCHLEMVLVTGVAAYKPGMGPVPTDFKTRL
jgi:hypothetical protein